MVDGGLKAFSTDKPFVPEAVDARGVLWAATSMDAHRVRTDGCP